MTIKANSVLDLKTLSHQPIELTSSKLEQWFARVENPQAKKEEYNQLSTQLLSRFGIKSSASLIVYLNSPEGKVITGLLEKELAIEEEAEEEERFEQLELRMKHRRFIIYLLLGLLHKQEAFAKKAQQEIQEQIEKQQHHQKPVQPTPQSELVVKTTVQSLLESEMALERMMEIKLKQTQILEIELLQFPKTLMIMNTKQQVLHKNLLLQNETLQKELHLLTTQLAAVQSNRITLQLAPKFEPKAPTPELAKPQIPHMKQVEQVHRNIVIQHMQNLMPHPNVIARNQLEEIQRLKMSSPRMSPPVT